MFRKKLKELEIIKMQSSVFLIQQNCLISGEKMLMSAELKECVT